MKVRLLGNGGHAGNIKEICRLNGDEIDDDSTALVLAYGALTCEKLEQRASPFENHQLPAGAVFPNIIHPTAIGNGNLFLLGGIQVMAGVIIQNNATIRQFCIINTGAIIEHDAVIGKGCHIAPGAVVLGDAKVGDFCFVGANAVIVQGCTVPPRTFIKANSVWKQK
jgi:UDP-3-O-[3-hydroxymyristoyl] glucosamine N-acyltransferase